MYSTVNRFWCRQVALMFLTKGPMHNEAVWRGFLEAASRLQLRKTAPVPTRIDLNSVVGGELKPAIPSLQEDDYLGFRIQHRLKINYTRWHQLTDLPEMYQETTQARALKSRKGRPGNERAAQYKCQGESGLVDAAIKRLITGDILEARLTLTRTDSSTKQVEIAAN